MDVERARRRLRLRDLETLVAVVEAGGMHKAATALHRSQPAVSKGIAELEDALGVPLLERGRRGVVPTAYGDALTRRARALVDELRAALRELAHMADPDGGEVRLGCMETLHAGLIGAAVAEFTERHPRMRFTLESAQAHELVAHFLAGRLVDFVVARPLDLPLPPGVVGEPLFHDRLVVFAGKGHRLARRRTLSIADLHGERWILGRNEASPHSPVGMACAAAGLGLPPRLVSSGSLNLRYGLLDTGRFLTCLPHSLLPWVGVRSTLRPLPVELPVWPMPTMVMTLEGRTLPAAAKRFLLRVRELALPFSGDGVGT